MDYTEVVQCQLKTPGDLREHLERNGRARHMIHDIATDWWWFCDNRNRLLEYVFNSGKSVSFVRISESCEHPDGGWEAVLESGHSPVNVERISPYQCPSMTIDELNDLFWTDFLSQDIDSFAYWDIDNANNDLDEYIFYREILETGAHVDPPVLTAA